MNTNKQTELDVPQLTLDETPVLKVEEVIAQANDEAIKAQEKPVEVITEPEFTAEEQKVIDEFVDKIDITDTNIILSSGTGAQKHIARCV